MSDQQRNSRLPPPAFPPGSRRHVHRNSTNHAPANDGVAADAFISPDDPLPSRTDKVAQAFISPDDPIPARPWPRPVEAAFIQPDDPLPERDDDPSGQDDEDGVVTGMGLDAHMDPGELASGGDPYVLEVVHAVGKLAAALKRKGEAGLRTSMEMSRFEATLRAYCVGYIAGRRAEEATELDIPDWGEAIPEDG